MPFLPVRPGELDLDTTLRSGQVFRFRKGEDGTWAGGEGTYAWRLREVDGGLEWEGNGSEAILREFFNLDVDAVALQGELCRREPSLTSEFEAFPGLRVVRATSAVETLFAFLCTANNHLLRIQPMVETLGRFGDGSFPTVERLARVEPEELWNAGFGYRSRTIPKVAQEILARREAWLEGLRTASYGEAHRELVSLPSVGNKLADCVCLYGLHHSEATPIDTHVWQVLTRTLFPEWAGKAMTEHRYRTASQALRDRFGELAGWAQLLIYHHNMRRPRSSR